MSVGRPIDSPLWATDSLYVAPGKDWDATPTKSQPSDSKKGTGFVPDADDAAEEDNWVLSTHGKILRYLDNVVQGSSFTLYDDFIDATIGARWGLSGHGTESIFDDSANAMGTVQFNISSQTAIMFFAKPIAGVGTGDFACSARIKVLNKGNCNVNFGISGGSEVRFTCDLSNAHWYTLITTSGMGGILTTSTVTGYQILTIFRCSGVVYFLIDGIPVAGSFAYTANIDSFLFFVSGLNPGGSSAVDIDYVKLWLDR